MGGFLGAGKTTLLLAASRELNRRGLRIALILNDQGDDLVDTEYAIRHGLQAAGVTGGCFCCRYPDMVGALEAMRATSPDVIFAEPVGSCTDIAASIVRPLLEHHFMQYRVAPLTVLVDPGRARFLLQDDADPHLSFLFRTQMEEADLICFTKSDLFPDPPSIPAPSARQISATTGQGVPAWLDEVLSGTLSCGSKLLDIDYQQYAQAETALAWLNAQASFTLRQPLSPAMLLGPLFDRLNTDLTEAGVLIIHLKAILQTETGFLKAAICSNGQAPSVEGMLDASPALHHELLLNLHAKADADQVRRTVETAFRQFAPAPTSLRLACFHPSPPLRPPQAVAQWHTASHPENT